MKYPTLFALSMDIMPIQGSAVPCERVFSSSKETMTPRRNQIKPPLMEGLQLIKFSLKQPRSMDFTAGTDKASQLRDLESRLSTEIRLPSDMNVFIGDLKAELAEKFDLWDDDSDDEDIVG